MPFQQLETPLPVHIVGKGKGMSFGVIDYGPEHNLIWVTALDDSGEIWCAPNPLVRMRANWTFGRPAPRDAASPEPVAHALPPDVPPDAGPRKNPARHKSQLHAVPLPGADAEHSAFP